jgi:hypothetical protein
MNPISNASAVMMAIRRERMATIVGVSGRAVKSVKE